MLVGLSFVIVESVGRLKLLLWSLGPPKSDVQLLSRCLHRIVLMLRLSFGNRYLFALARRVSDHGCFSDCDVVGSHPHSTIDSETRLSFFSEGAWQCIQHVLEC